VTLLGDGQPPLPGLVRAAVDEPVTCILDWWHISMRVHHIEQALRGVYAPIRNIGQGWKSSSGELGGYGI
jgi:hypothetical protein